MAVRPEVRIAIFDLMGRSVSQLLSGSRDAGEQAARWDGKDRAGRPVEPGVYVVRFEAEGAVHHARFGVVR